MIDNNLSLYIHIPFCKSKCYYCDFVSGPASEEEKNNYVNQLIADIKKEGINYKNYQIYSIFIGGGTPSLLSASQMQRILEAIKENFHMQQSFKPLAESSIEIENPIEVEIEEEIEVAIEVEVEVEIEVAIEMAIEITIEVNPGTVDMQKLEAYYNMGINRISIGLQSANDKELQNLGRIHSYEEFLQTYHNAIEVGFTNINVDIMSAIPEQTIASYEDTLLKVCKLQPQHISAYSLIIEEGTPFYEMYEEKTIDTKGKLPDEDEEREMYQRTKETLSLYGYERYEISNYAKKGNECRHNEVYWKRGNYLGFGSAAASMVENIRWSNCGELPHLLSEEEQMSEFMFLGLRMMKGISKLDFYKHFQTSLEEVYHTKLSKLQHQGLIKQSELDDKVCLTEKGIDLSNYVFCDFI